VVSPLTTADSAQLGRDRPAVPAWPCCRSRSVPIVPPRRYTSGVAPRCLRRRSPLVSHAHQRRPGRQIGHCASGPRSRSASARLAPPTAAAWPPAAAAPATDQTAIRAAAAVRATVAASGLRCRQWHQRRPCQSRLFGGRAFGESLAQTITTTIFARPGRRCVHQRPCVARIRSATAPPRKPRMVVPEQPSRALEA
jgi:hypothetical protein